MDTLENIRTFLAVVRAGSFSAAARGLETVPSVVAKRVGQLEHQIKAKLFERTTRHLKLTEIGERYYPRFLAITAEVDKALTDLAGSKARLEERLKIKCPTTLAVTYLGEVFTAFQQAHPGVRLEMILMDRSVNPIEEGFDIAVGALPSSYTSVADIPLCAMPRKLIASPAYLERHGVPRHPRELTDRDCLVFRPTGNIFHFDSPEGPIDVDVPAIFSVNDSHVLLSAVEKDLGLAIMAEHISRESIAAGRAVEVLPEYRVQDLWVKALVPENRRQNAAVQALLKWLVDACQPVAPWDRPKSRTLL